MLHFFLVVLSLFCGWQTALAAPWELPPDVKTLTVNGYPMAFLERGEGQAVVLVHGAGVDYRHWQAQTAKPPPGFRFIAVSLRHYYPEPWDGKGETFSVQQHANDLAAFIGRLGVGPVFVVGHSRGGLVTFRMAQARADLVRKLILMEPAFVALVQSLAPPKGGGRLAAIRKAVAARFEQGDIDGGLEVFADRNAPGIWKLSSEERRQISRDNAWTLIAGRPEVPVTCEELAALRMPVALIQGETTPRVNADIVEAAHKCLPSASRAVVPNAGHGMHAATTGNPAAFDAVLLRFLSN